MSTPTVEGLFKLIVKVCSGRNETLNSKYLEILEVKFHRTQSKLVTDAQQSHHEHFPLLLDARRLDTMFKTIGADMAQFDTQTELAPISEPQSATKPLLPPPLISIARLLYRAAPWWVEFLKPCRITNVVQATNESSKSCVVSTLPCVSGRPCYRRRRLFKPHTRCYRSHYLQLRR